MVWFAVDDNLAFHPKVMEAGNAAMGLWVRAGAWSAANLTDGFVPTRIAMRLGSRNMCNSLVTSGLFDVVLGGYQFHDWEVRQPSKADVEKRREQERLRKRRQRDGTVVPLGHPRDDPQDSVRTDPSQPLSSYVRGECPVGSDPSPPPHGDAPPSQFCEDHPYGTSQPCRPCMLARKHLETWLDTAQHKIKQRTQQATNKERAAWFDHIPDCNLCDDNGMRLPDGRFKCDGIDRTQTHANGMAAIQEKLNEAKAKKANRQ